MEKTPRKRYRAEYPWLRVDCKSPRYICFEHDRCLVIKIVLNLKGRLSLLSKWYSKYMWKTFTQHLQLLTVGEHGSCRSHILRFLLNNCDRFRLQGIKENGIRKRFRTLMDVPDCRFSPTGRFAATGQWDKELLFVDRRNQCQNILHDGWNWQKGKW